MSAAFFAAPEQRVLDTYQVPQLRADFAERVVRRALAGAEIHVLPAPDAADNMRQRRHRSPWARAGRRMGIVAALSLFSVAAAALGILGPVERLPIIGELLAESVSQPSAGTAQAEPRQASLVASDQTEITPPTLAAERSFPLTGNAPVSDMSGATRRPTRDLADAPVILSRQIDRPRIAAPERGRRPALQRAARAGIDEARRMPRGEREIRPQRVRERLARGAPEAAAAVQAPSVLNTPAQIAERPVIGPEMRPEIRSEPQPDIAPVTRPDVRPDIRPPTPPVGADRQRLRPSRDAARAARQRAREIQQRRRALRKRRR